METQDNTEQPILTEKAVNIKNLERYQVHAELLQHHIYFDKANATELKHILERLHALFLSLDVHKTKMEKMDIAEMIEFMKTNEYIESSLYSNTYKVQLISLISSL